MPSRIRITGFLLALLFLIWSAEFGHAQSPRIIVSDADSERLFDTSAVQLNGTAEPKVIVASANTVRNSTLGLPSDQKLLEAPGFSRVLFAGANSNTTINLAVPSQLSEVKLPQSSRIIIQGANSNRSLALERPAFLGSATDAQPSSQAQSSEQAGDPSPTVTPTLAVQPTQSQPAREEPATKSPPHENGNAIDTTIAKNQEATPTPTVFPEVAAAREQNRGTIVAAVITFFGALLAAVIAGIVAIFIKKKG